MGTFRVWGAWGCEGLGFVAFMASARVGRMRALHDLHQNRTVQQRSHIGFSSAEAALWSSQSPRSTQRLYLEVSG